MYHHSFLFVIISQDNQIEQALNGIEPLEDCDYTFYTVPREQDAPVNSRRLDVAFIYDYISGAKFPEDMKRHEECIAVVENGASLLTDSAAASLVSDIWVMPEKGDFDKELLAVDFSRLANRMKHQADARKQGICFDTLINSVPNIAWFKDVSGAHLIVNDSFCQMVGKKKRQIYKQGHCYIWNASKEDEEVCLTSDQIIMESRKTNTFEECIQSGTDKRLLKSYKSALIDVNGQVFGTCGIAHDVTDFRNMSTELDIVLDSIPFAVIVEDAQDIVLNTNARFDRYFPEFSDIVGKSSLEWKKSIASQVNEEGEIKEVMVQTDEESKVLVYEEEPILDIFQEVIGKIVILTDITMERSLLQQNEHTANTDYLTGLNNRRNLMHYLDSVNERDDVTLLMLDLDNFKQVNDNYGHGAGDRALVKTAEILNDSFRDEFISRWGGDEFMVVITGKELSEVKQMAEQLLVQMRDTYGQQEEFRLITASVGVVNAMSVPKKERTVSGLLHLTDGQLYKAKNNGKNCYFVYGEDK